MSKRTGEQKLRKGGQYVSTQYGTAERWGSSIDTDIVTWSSEILRDHKHSLQISEFEYPELLHNKCNPKVGNVKICFNIGGGARASAALASWLGGDGHDVNVMNKLSFFWKLLKAA